MSQQITYDETAIASPGDVAAGPLGVELSNALMVTAYVTWDQRAPVGSQLIVTYESSLTAPQEATALGVIMGHDATAYGDLGDVAAIFPAETLTPANNQDVKVAAADIVLLPGRKIDDGTISITSRVGAPGAQKQGGATIVFDAQNESGSLDVGETVNVRGNVNGYKVQISTSGNTISVELRRRGGEPITTVGTARYSVELL